MHNSHTNSGIKRQLRYRGDVSGSVSHIEVLQNEETHKLPKVKSPTIVDDVGVAAAASHQRVYNGKYDKSENQ